MKTIAIISQKGGAGKTTLALHLATASALAGRNTAIIDLDPQASAANWSDRRESDVPVVLSAHASRLAHEMKRVEETKGDVLIIDTAPHSDSAALEAAKAADLVLVPCRPAILDIEAITNTLNLVKTTGSPIFVVMNAVAPQGTEASEAAEAIAALGVDVCPVQLRQRVAFSRALITGQSAQEFEPGGKAAREAEQLYLHVCTLEPSQACTREGGGMSNKFAAALKPAKATQPTAVETDQPEASIHARPSRKSTKHIGGYFDPAVSKQLREIALAEDSSVQALLGEAIDMLFHSRRKPTIASRKTKV